MGSSWKPGPIKMLMQSQEKLSDPSGTLCQRYEHLSGLRGLRSQMEDQWVNLQGLTHQQACPGRSEATHSLSSSPCRPPRGTLRERVQGTRVVFLSSLAALPSPCKAQWALFSPVRNTHNHCSPGLLVSPKETRGHEKGQACCVDKKHNLLWSRTRLSLQVPWVLCMHVCMSQTVWSVSGKDQVKVSS